jgi:hypothetical protein
MSISHFTMVQSILKELSYNDWTFVAGHSGDRVYVYTSWQAEDNFRPVGVELQKSRRWLIRHGASRSEIIQTAFKCVLTAIEHEARERFLYANRAIFVPHHSIDALWAISEHMEPK